MSTLSFGVVCVLLPFSGLLPTLQQRLLAIYFIGACLGFSFGSVYSRFQERTWSLLPKNIDIANSMGFCSMCKMIGIGIGNFGAGLILDFFKASAESGDSGKYQIVGYFVMCFLCATVVFVSAALVSRIPKLARMA